MLGEFRFAFTFQEGISLHSFQHVTIAGFFLLNGVSELCVHYKVDGIPRRFNFIVGALALAIMGEP